MAGDVGEQDLRRVRGLRALPGHEIAVDYRYDHSSRGNLRIIEFEFDVVEDEYWDAAPTYRRQLVRERIVRRFTKEHSVRLVEGEDRLFSLVREQPVPARSQPN